MSAFTYEIDVEEVERELANLIARLDNPAGFHSNVAQHLASSTQENFAREESPDGVKWKALLPSTIRGRIGKGISPLGILRASGKLRGSIRTQSSADSASIGSPKEYAAIHQLGGEIKKEARAGEIFLKRNARTGEIGNRFVKRKAANAVQDVQIPAHTIKIPARPFLGIGESDRVAIINYADQWLSGE